MYMALHRILCKCYLFEMSFNRDTSAGYLVNHAARLFARHLDAGLAPLNLSTGPFPLLLHLWQQDGLTQKDLVERLGYEQPTVAATLSRMERDGLVARRPDPRDGRAQRIWLTDLGRGLRGDAEHQAEMVNVRALAGLSPQETEQFIAMMRRVLASLQDEEVGKGRASRLKRQAVGAKES